MKIDFTKMHGLGNDFIVIDGIRQRVALQHDDIVRLADRRLGIGCDQLLLVEKPIGADADFRYRIFNADGTEVEQCGNGARCFVRFVFDSGLTDKRRIRVETAKGIIVPQLEDDGTVSVDMGIPLFAAADIPLTADTAASTIDFPLPVAGGIVRVDLVSMGNPHAVQQVDNVDEAPVARLGPLISSHPFFPQGINAGFMQIRDRGHIDLRVFERGAGETPACGSGACAAVVAGIRHGLLDDTVEVQTRGGILTIRWNGPGHPVEMNGPVCTVYSGTVQLDHLQTQLINNIRAEQPRC